jgi:2-aminoethylphosphonate-pyruvate transaminase
MTARRRLLNPGPVTLSPRVRRALAEGPDLCHRELAFADLQRRVRIALVDVYPGTAATHTAILFAGSGTAAVESMVTSLVPADGTAVIAANGIYGERMAAMAARAGRTSIVVRSDWTAALDLPAIHAAMADPSVTHVLAVHHETTTGRLNDMAALAARCRDRGISLLLDAVSSYGAEWIDFSGWPVAAVAATANKCLHGVPGVSFVIADRRLLQRGGQGSSVYLDLFANHAAQEADRPAFTPAIQTTLALAEALAELSEGGGWQTRRAHYRDLSGRLRDGLDRVGFRTLLAADAWSSFLTAFRLPDGVGFDRLYAALDARDLVIYAGQQHLFDEIFRVSVMGDLGAQDLDELVEALSRFAG